MKILLDTHIFLWLITDNDRLSDKSKHAFTNPDNELFFSMASYWEICIKVSIGKLKLSKNWDKIIKDELMVNSVKLLPISTEHCFQVTQLPFHHRDPFDRIIISQAIIEQMHIMTIDSYFSLYEVNIVW